jgi:hypothetical protein
MVDRAPGWPAWLSSSGQRPKRSRREVEPPRPIAERSRRRTTLDSASTQTEVARGEQVKLVIIDLTDAAIISESHMLCSPICVSPIMTKKMGGLSSAGSALDCACQSHRILS